MMSWALSINWESELTRLRLVQQMGPMRAMELEPDYPAGNPITLEGVGSEEALRMLSTAGLLLNQYEAVKQWLGTAGDGQGSNSWVLAPKRSLNQRPILCSDPHLTLQMPGVWYENHLHAPGFQVSGASFTGAPGVMIGHNEQIAWGITNGFADVQDLYLERPHPDDAPDNLTRFAWRDGWEEAQVIEETICRTPERGPHGADCHYAPRPAHYRLAGARSRWRPPQHHSAGAALVRARRRATPCARRCA